MPIIKSAKKKLKQDAQRAAVNQKYKHAYKKGIKNVEKALEKTGKNASEVKKKAYAAIDKAAKIGIMHKNRAARLKSQVAKMVKAR